VSAPQRHLTPPAAIVIGHINGHTLRPQPTGDRIGQRLLILNYQNPHNNHGATVRDFPEH
jgi:hypothetical protein